METPSYTLWIMRVKFLFCNKKQTSFRLFLRHAIFFHLDSWANAAQEKSHNGLTSCSPKSYLFFTFIFTFTTTCSLFLHYIHKKNEYSIVASTSPSRFEAHAGLFRFLMKGIFDAYLMHTLWQKVYLLISNKC